jgi:hypothetical protein
VEIAHLRLLSCRMLRVCKLKQGKEKSDKVGAYEKYDLKNDQNIISNVIYSTCLSQSQLNVSLKNQKISFFCPKMGREKHYGLDVSSFSCFLVNPNPGVASSLFSTSPFLKSSTVG